MHIKNLNELSSDDYEMSVEISKEELEFLINTGISVLLDQGAGVLLGQQEALEEDDFELTDDDISEYH